MKTRLCLIVFFIFFVSIFTNKSLGGYANNGGQSYVNTLSQCISFNSSTRLITVSCKVVRLSDIDTVLNNPAIITKENRSNHDTSFTGNETWILKAGIVIKENAGLVIDSRDTKWLKMVPAATTQLQRDDKLSTSRPNVLQAHSLNNAHIIDPITDVKRTARDKKLTQDIINMSSKNNSDNPNGIHVYGSLVMDSVKVTSWDPEINDVIKFALGKRAGEELTKSDYDTAEPRPFIRVSEKATGTTKITNSELSYLGYSCSRCSGISFYGGNGSILKGNDIHHLLKGFYSNGMGYMTIEDNHFHDNYLYGIDPHTGTHDLVIRNNMVNDNNASGIICSKYCFNILIEGNKVYKNDAHGAGIMFSIHMVNSTARDNYIHDERRCISFGRSSNYNHVYNNTMSNCSDAVNLANTTNNKIHSNNITNSINGILFQNTTNIMGNNHFWNTTNDLVFLKDKSSRVLSD